MTAMRPQVLRNLPFLKELPDPVFEALLARGNLVRYSKGDSIWSPLRPAHLTARGGQWKAEGGMACEGNGIFVVMAGLVKSSYTTAEGRTVVSPFKLEPDTADKGSCCSVTALGRQMYHSQDVFKRDRDPIEGRAIMPAVLQICLAFVPCVYRAHLPCRSFLGMSWEGKISGLHIC
jgi:hypothetical protein